MAVTVGTMADAVRSAVGLFVSIPVIDVVVVMLPGLNLAVTFNTPVEPAFIGSFITILIPG